MTDYSKYSDFEINKAVAVALGFKPFGDEGSHAEIPFVKCGVSLYFDFCNCLEHWAKLLVDNKMNLHWYESEQLWTAVNYVDGNPYAFDWTSEKPGRAVAICFLMMKDAE